MPWAAVAAGAVVAGGVMTYMAGKEQADAAQNIANAQMAQQQQERALATQAALPSTTELMAQHEQIQATQAAMQRQQQLLAAVDPTLMEAGKQALDLLRGHEAQVVSPLRNERNAQRQRLVENLRAQMGPGAELGSAGAQVLNQFDRESAVMINQAQQQAVDTLLGSSQRTAQESYNGQAANAWGNVAGLAANQSERMVSAINRTSLTPYAGAPFVGEAAQARNNAQLGGMMMNVGSTALGAMYGGRNGLGSAGSSGSDSFGTSFNQLPTNYSDQLTMGSMQNPYGSGSYRYSGAAFADPNNG